MAATQETGKNRTRKPSMSARPIRSIAITTTAVIASFVAAFVAYILFTALKREFGLTSYVEYSIQVHSPVAIENPDDIHLPPHDRLGWRPLNSAHYTFYQAVHAGDRRWDHVAHIRTGPRGERLPATRHARPSVSRKPR